MCDTNSTHVARTYFNLLGGYNEQEQHSFHKGRNENASGTTWIPEVPKCFLKTLKKINEMIDNYARTLITELIGSPYGSPCFVAFLKILNKRKRKLFNSTCEKIISCCKNAETNDFSGLLLLFKDKIGSHFFQGVVSCESTAIGSQMYQVVCGSNFQQLAVHKHSNFVVQSLITSPYVATSEERFELVFTLVTSCIDQLYQEKRFGV